MKLRAGGLGAEVYGTADTVETFQIVTAMGVAAAVVLAAPAAVAGAGALASGAATASAATVEAVGGTVLASGFLAFRSSVAVGRGLIAMRAALIPRVGAPCARAIEAVAAQIRTISLLTASLGSRLILRRTDPELWNTAESFFAGFADAVYNSEVPHTNNTAYAAGYIIGGLVSASGYGYRP